MSENNATLIKLSDAGQTVADDAEDIRGRTVLDSEGEEVGQVDDLLIDELEHKVRMLRVEHGGILGFGATASFVPVDAIVRITLDAVYLTQPGQHIAGAPGYDPALKELDDLINVYGYYGYTPFWGPGYMYPAYPFYR